MERRVTFESEYDWSSLKSTVETPDRVKFVAISCFEGEGPGESSGIVAKTSTNTLLDSMAVLCATPISR